MKRVSMRLLALIAGSTCLVILGEDSREVLLVNNLN